MNVDILINKPPSIKWYFIIGVSCTVVVLAVVSLINWVYPKESTDGANERRQL